MPYNPHSLHPNTTLPTSWAIFFCGKNVTKLRTSLVYNVCLTTITPPTSIKIRTWTQNMLNMILTTILVICSYAHCLHLFNENVTSVSRQDLRLFSCVESNSYHAILRTCVFSVAAHTSLDFLFNFRWYFLLYMMLGTSNSWGTTTTLPSWDKYMEWRKKTGFRAHTSQTFHCNVIFVDIQLRCEDCTVCMPDFWLLSNSCLVNQVPGNGLKDSFKVSVVARPEWRATVYNVRNTAESAKLLYFY